MKKYLGLLVLVLVLLGMFGFAQAAGPGTECGDLGLPVDVLCHDSNDPTDPADDEDCVIWINGVDPQADGCYNESDAPPPPAVNL